MKISADLSRKMGLASFICAILVVAIHIPAIEESTSPFAGAVKQFFSNGICRIAVPYFFLASGFFLARSSMEKGWYVAAVRKRIASLVVPYVFWAVAWMVFLRVMVCASSAFRSHGKIEFPAWPSLIGVLGLDFSVLPEMYVLWFVRALIVLTLVSPVIILAVRAKTFGRLFIVALFSYFLFADRIPCPLVKGIFPPDGIAYFTLGVYLALHGLQIGFERYIYAVFFMLGMCILAVSASRALTILVWRQLGVIVLLVGFWGLLPSRALPQVFRRTAFPIYLLHLFILMPLAMAVHAVTGSYAYNASLVGYFTYWAAGVLGAWFAGRVLLKTGPLARLCFGGR